MLSVRCLKKKKKTPAQWSHVISNSPVRAKIHVKRLYPRMTHITANIKWHLNSAGSEDRGGDLEEKGTHRRIFIDVFFLFFIFINIFAVLHCLLLTLHHYKASFKKKKKVGGGVQCGWVLLYQPAGTLCCSLGPSVAPADVHRQ